MAIHTSISALSGPIVNHPERGGCLPAANPPAFARRAGGGQSRGVWAEGPLHGGAVVEEEASARAGTTKPLKTPHRQLPSAIGVAFDNAPDRKLPGRGKFLALGDNPFHERRFTSAWEDIAHQRGPGPQHWSPSWVSPEVFDCARRLHQLGPCYGDGEKSIRRFVHFAWRRSNSGIGNASECVGAGLQLVGVVPTSRRWR